MAQILILAATFLSAFLLFVVQPLYAKYLLPYFGGTSSVWTISVFFYSATLLLGYLYASMLVAWSNRVAGIIHGSLLLMAVSILFFRWTQNDSPLLVDTVSNQEPALAVLLTLTFGLGVPVLLLASTSVVTQHLYARLTAKEPYALFALSNTGSLMGLAAYPFFFEPLTPLYSQSIWWAWTFVIFAMLLISAGWLVGKHRTKAQNSVDFLHNVLLKNRGYIVFMAAIPTFLLASSTEYLSKGIASFPLMWVIPLTLYLISFIVAFGNRLPVVKQPLLGFITLLSIIPVFALLPVINSSAMMYWLGFLGVVLSFFLISTYFHSRVYALRPRINDLGLFYVYLTFGGALGSGVVGFILPTLLNDQIEIYVVFSLLTIYFSVRYMRLVRGVVENYVLRGAQGILVALSLIFVVTMVFGQTTIESDRNFYGTLKVLNTERMVRGELVPVRVLVNGATSHGLQSLDERYHTEAASYYGYDSGIDIAIRSFLDANTLPRVAVVGLGAGMMNAYCDRVESLSYFEINPAVLDLAEKHFTYLDMCPEKTTVQLGDGRLLLENEVNQGGIKYDVIMMDAFTDDAIPVHLLTTEAFKRAYEPLLSDKGIVAFHVSNKYLNLYPPIVGMALDNGYKVVVVRNVPDGTDGLQFPTSWVMVTAGENVESLLSFKNTSHYKGEEIVWTDYKNSVMNVLSLSGSHEQN